ncbi:hypothetical protein H5410_008956 [Solanum commersonii]|uniref:Uncharacterized protein n=1 Tax=Solanum commersonii TaxID=4109 RepID=A0A9J6AI54_SOLCO|nr:hypothetical protein H5410_008956 [Solanum commersonii]
MLKPNADSGYIRPAHDSLGLVCSGSFLQLSLFYIIIHRLPIHNEAGSLLSLPLWSFFPDQERFALCSSHLLPFRYYSSDSTPSARFFQKYEEYEDLDEYEEKGGAEEYKEEETQ